MRRQARSMSRRVFRESYPDLRTACVCCPPSSRWSQVEFALAKFDILPATQGTHRLFLTGSCCLSNYYSFVAAQPMTVHDLSVLPGPESTVHRTCLTLGFVSGMAVWVGCSTGVAITARTLCNNAWCELQASKGWRSAAAARSW